MRFIYFVQFTQLQSGRTGNHAWYHGELWGWAGNCVPQVLVGYKRNLHEIWKGGVKQQPLCSDGGCGVNRHGCCSHVVSLICLLTLAVQNNSWVCTFSSSVSSFRFFESWLLGSFVAQGVCFFCRLSMLPGFGRQTWLPGSTLSPWFTSSLLLAVLTYNNFGVTTRRRSLPESSSPAPTIMSGLIPPISSLLRITYGGPLPPSNLSCSILSDSNLLGHCSHEGGWRWGDKTVSGWFERSVSEKLRTSSVRCSENEGRGCTRCKTEKLRSCSSVFI